MGAIYYVNVWGLVAWASFPLSIIAIAGCFYFLLTVKHWVFTRRSLGNQEIDDLIPSRMRYALVCLGIAAAFMVLGFLASFFYLNP
jgi:hypothetical protein